MWGNTVTKQKPCKENTVVTNYKRIKLKLDNEINK